MGRNVERTLKKIKKSHEDSDVIYSSPYLELEKLALDCAELDADVGAD